jgi:peptide-methionine (R)-S-oxide reductase
MIDRRILLASVASLLGLAAFRWLRASPASAAEKFEIEKTDAEWRAQLTAQQYEILRQQGTERPGSSPLLEEHRKGIFACAGCDLPLFSSDTKFESGTGWPSFYQPLDNAVGKTEDRTFGMLRTEIHCRRCGGHLGHVFDDGPKPTGLRYCMDGFALVFHPASPSATCDTAAAAPEFPICHCERSEDVAFFTQPHARRMHFAEPRRQRRARHLAVALLGA